MLAFLDPVLVHLHDLLDALTPVLPAGAAVVLLTLGLRLALHPLNRRTQHQAVRRRDLELRERRLEGERLRRERERGLRDRRDLDLAVPPPG